MKINKEKMAIAVLVIYFIAVIVFAVFLAI
jgi:hypothetical protein